MRSGRVTAAQVAAASAEQAKRGGGVRLGEVLLEMGVISRKELERQIRIQIEAVIFELLSWSEGFFRFEEGPVQGEPMVEISTEALLMEGARRIDEWSRIAGRVPSVLAIPRLTSLRDDQQAPMLDLLPSEWEVLTMIDGELNLRAIAERLARTEFDTAKVVYGLVSTGVVELEVPASAAELAAARTPTPAAPMAAVAEGINDLEGGFRNLLRGDLDGAVAAWTAWLRVHPDDAMTEQVRGGLEAAQRLLGLVRARDDE
jgi:hypothetical protein